MEASSSNAVQTAAELRRQLHMMKARDRHALDGARGANVLSTEFLRSHWFTAALTGTGVFLALLMTQPLFVQSEGKPDMRKIGMWSILGALIVALGPILFQKFLAK